MEVPLIAHKLVTAMILLQHKELLAILPIQLYQEKDSRKGARSRERSNGSVHGEMTEERFIDLVRVEQEPLRRFLLALCGGDSALADDLAQDAITRAYVASGSYLGLSSFRTWLFRIAYNCYVDYSRKKHPELVPIEGKDTLNLPAEETSDAAFRFQQINQALERLPEKEKAVIILFYFEDRSIKETASILGIPSGTVKYHLSMGRAHLKKLISL